MNTPHQQQFRQGLISPYVPTLIRGLFVEIPPEGSVWPLERREAWFAAARVIFDQLYLDKEPEQSEGRGADA